MDGHLEFSRARSSKLVVDTMYVDTVGQLSIGTKASPIPPQTKVEIVIANNGPIDVNWDPMLLSRGLVLHGTSVMHGEPKTVHMKVAVDPRAGDQVLVMKEPPFNWRVGDKIVVAGTYYKGYAYNNQAKAKIHHPPQDDVRIIQRVDGNRVHLDTPLEFDHLSPRPDLKTSVANYTRNILITTEDPETAEVHERGHVMFMHSDKVDVRFAEFNELGRSNKEILGKRPVNFDPIQPTSNVKGRYSLHLHRTGVENLRNPAIVLGNSVVGSPGWGYVHHNSNAIFHNNASYNTYAAAYVAETGNETGAWTENIAIYSKGRTWGGIKGSFTSEEKENFDLAKTGDGFYFQGRMVRSVGNIAASVNNGFAYFHRNYGGGMIKAAVESLSFPAAMNFQATGNARIPILSFHQNETFAAKNGMSVHKTGPNQHHDIHTKLTNFKAWSVVTGAHFGYTAHYIIKDFDLIGRISGAHEGIGTGGNLFDFTILNPKIFGFKEAITATARFTFPVLPEDIQYNVVSIATDSDVVGHYTMHDGLEFPGRFEVNLTSTPIRYLGRPGADNRVQMEIQGVKRDSLGDINIDGPDRFSVVHGEAKSIISQGYYQNSDEKKYIILEDYYTDRGTLETHKFAELVEVGPDIDITGDYYNNPPNLGHIDLNSQAPLTAGESTTAIASIDLVIDVLSNDSDPDGDTLRVRGIEPPVHGFVFDNEDGTITYRSDFGYVGEDSFKYWVTDGNGNFSPAIVNVNVINDQNALPQPRNLRLGY